MTRLTCLFLALLLSVNVFAGSKKEAGYVPVHDYDIGRDPAKDLKAAMGEAQRTNRNILLEIGGHWCKWCMYLDKLYRENPELGGLREKNFVVVYVNVSEQNDNEKFMAQFPKVKGYPHVFVLDANGKLLKSEGTDGWEAEGGVYDLGKIRTFLTENGPNHAL